MIPSIRYFESHVTVEPVFDERLELFKALCEHEEIRFKVAKLLMQKRAHEVPETSKKDSFCTGHDACYEDLRHRMTILVSSLRRAGFEVLRFKIEAILLDSRSGDDLGGTS